MKSNPSRARVQNVEPLGPLGPLDLLELGDQGDQETQGDQGSYTGSTRFSIELSTPNRPDAWGRDPMQRLRAALKVLQRRHDLKCTGLAVTQPDVQAAPKATGEPEQIRLSD